MMHSNKSLSRYILLSAMLIGWLLSACSSPKKKQDQAHLSAKEMESLLTDIYLAEAYTASLPVDTTARPRVVKNLDSLALFYKAILDKHQVTYQSFASSMDWYRNNPGEMDSIYRHMQLQIEQTKNRLLK